MLVVLSVPAGVPDFADALVLGINVTPPILYVEIVHFDTNIFSVHRGFPPFFRSLLFFAKISVTGR
jgi:hypothetical protein